MAEQGVQDNTRRIRRQVLQHYWRKNMWTMFVLLTIWAVVGLGFGVLLADQLNAVSIGGFPLGFWFAQQGSILVFVLLILVYALLMNLFDRQYHGDIARQSTEQGDSATN